MVGVGAEKAVDILLDLENLLLGCEQVHFQAPVALLLMGAGSWGMTPP